MIKLLESKALPDLRRGRYPDERIGGRMADVLRAVAGELRRLSSRSSASATGRQPTEQHPGRWSRRSPRVAVPSTVGVEPALHLDPDQLVGAGRRAQDVAADARRS